MYKSANRNGFIKVFLPSLTLLESIRRLPIVLMHCVEDLERYHRSFHFHFDTSVVRISDAAPLRSEALPLAAISLLNPVLSSPIEVFEWNKSEIRSH